MKTGLKVLIGAVPFGEDNVGDEAILECVVATLRSICPDPEITVSTNDQDRTRSKLGVQTIPLVGFGLRFPRRDFERVLSAQDVFIWAGATGLSDYPEEALSLVDAAQKVGITTVVWCVGMNDELNPAKYSVRPGRRRRLLRALTRLTGGLIDAVSLQEASWSSRTRARIRRGLNTVDLIVVRDQETQRELERCGVETPILVGSDPAIRTPRVPIEDVPLPDSVLQTLHGSRAKIGVCISAQRPVRDRNSLVRFLDRLVENDAARILFVPMNPVTDLDLMRRLQNDMENASRSLTIDVRLEPAELAAVVAGMDLVITSRLHLMILASMSHVPFVGISRGSKVDNFLAAYGLESVGDVDSCDLSALWDESQRLLRDRASFEERSRSVRASQLRRLDQAEVELRRLLERL